MVLATQISRDSSEVKIRNSSGLIDDEWDHFLKASPHGHFQQASIWADAKSIDGWRPVRTVVSKDGRAVGGFQILTRRTRFGSIGYVSKGPTVQDEEENLAHRVADLLVLTVKSIKLRALIIQTPDRSRLSALLARDYGFLPDHLTSVNSATLVVPLEGGMDQVKSRMRRTTVLELKRAIKRGMTIREGNAADLGLFFKLMISTCERQQTQPSPGSEEALRRIWTVFQDRAQVRLSFAEYQGEPVAACICLGFGDRLTFWKKGWSGTHREKHPNQLVMFEAIEWSQKQGYKLFDCAGMNRHTAEALLKGEELSEDQKKARDFFILGYGGIPVLLPESQAYISSPLLRLAYSKLGSLPVFQRWTDRAVKRL